MPYSSPDILYGLIGFSKFGKCIRSRQVVCVSQYVYFSHAYNIGFSYNYTVKISVVSKWILRKVTFLYEIFYRQLCFFSGFLIVCVYSVSLFPLNFPLINYRIVLVLYTASSFITMFLSNSHVFNCQ